MAYNPKYQFYFQDAHGVDHKVLIHQNGYSGSVINRNLGQTPVLKRKHSGRIYGTSLEIYAQCAVGHDGEFTAFYTSNPTEYWVQLLRGNGNNAETIWQGFVSPELYGEPDIAPPYNVQIVATDGLGELKLHNFEAQGDKTLSALFDYLLGFTGLSSTVNLISSLSAKDSSGNNVSVAQVWGTATINIDYKAGKTCYEVLQYLLNTLCASITYHDTYWVVWRDNDLTLSDLAYNTVTRMGGGGLWPVGQLNTKVEPAKNQIAVEAPYHRWSRLVNPDMREDAGWSDQSVEALVLYNATYEAYRFYNNPPSHSHGVHEARLYQALTMFATNEMELAICCGNAVRLGGGPNLDIIVSFTVSGLAVLYLFKKKETGEFVWLNAMADPNIYEFPSIPIAQAGVRSEESITIPGITDTGYDVEGSFTVTLRYNSVGANKYDFCVYSCFLYQAINKGYKDVLKINNSSRGEGTTTEIAHGRITSDMMALYYGNLRGVFTKGGKFLTTFRDRCFTSYSDFLSLAAKNHARLVALPRLRINGKLNVPDSLGIPPLLLVKNNVAYFVEGSSWDILNAELEIDALSLPSVTLDITSETLVDMTASSLPSSTSGSPGGVGSNVSWEGSAQNGYQKLVVNGDQNHMVALSGHGHAISDVSGLQTALDGKQTALTFDDTPTAGSSNPVKSGGIKSALDGKQATLTFDDAPTQNSNNPVKSGGIWTSIQNLLQAIGQKASAAWGSIVNNKASLTVNDTSRTVLLDGWVPGTAGDHGTPVFAAPRTETETYKYKRGSSGEPADVTTSVTKGEPRAINHIGTHPELSSPIVVPGLMNDLAYFITRGGTCALYVNNTERTDALYNYDKAALFNLAPGSMQFQGDNTVSDVTYHRYLTSPNDVVKLILDPTGIADVRVSLGTFSQQERYSTRYSWGSILSVDFGNDHWGPQQVKVTVKYGYYTISGSQITIVEDTDHRERFQFDGQTFGGVKQNLDFVTMTLNSQTSYGIVGIELEMTGFNQEGDTYCKPRISEVILINLNSTGAAEAFMSRYRDDAIYRSITPATSATFDLGASGARWRQVHAKRVYLSSSAYLEVDASGKAHLYGATGLVVENGDIASAGAPQS